MTRNEAIDFLVNHPAAFGRLIGFDRLRDEIHDPWLKIICSDLGERNEFTLQAHRGSYKSTCITVACCILILLKPKETIGIFRNTGVEGKYTIKAVGDIIRTKEFQIFSNAIWGCDCDITQINTTELNVSLSSNAAKIPILSTFGIGNSITGKHFDRIITDDIVQIGDRYSQSAREATKVFVMELHNILNRGGFMFNVGTPWHKDDAFSIMKNIEKHDCYETGLIDAETLRDIRSSMSASLFAANYELKHINDEGALFKDPKWVNDDEYLIGGRIHIDAAYGGKDCTALTVFNEKDGQYYYYGKVWADSVMNHYGEILAIHNRFKCGTVFCETNGDKGFLAKDLRGLGLIVNTYSEGENKFVKIVTHLTKIWDKISFHEQTDHEYMRQILEFQEKVEPDDCPDSAACAARILSRPSPRLRIFG